MNHPYIFLGAIGTQEVIGIIIVVLILFGGRKIPELMRGLGKGIRQFNDAKNNVRREIEEGAPEAENKNPWLYIFSTFWLDSSIYTCV